MSNTFASDIVGPLYWWMGQIVDDSNWYPNLNPKIHSRDDVPGYGSRYKVRIFGRDVKTKDGVSDDQLDWVEVALPVTAGSGHAGSMQTPNLRQGDYVVGFYKDGIAATQPVIAWVLENHSQTRLFGGDPRENFVARSGYKGKSGDKPSATKNIYSEGPSSPPLNESPQPNQSTVNQPDQEQDGARCHYVPKTRACDGPSGELKGIQRHLKNLLKFINRIKSAVNGFLGAVSDLTGQISSLINEFTIFISSLVKTIIDKIRGFVVNKFENGIKDLMEMLPPNKRATANEASEKATDGLQCVFNKIIKGLLSIVKNLLEDIVDKYINAPMCAVESFVGSILSTVVGDITSGIQSAMGVVEGVLGKVSDISGQVFGALDTFIGIIKFLSCDEELDCTMLEEWSFWGGAKCKAEQVRAGIGSFYKGVLDGVGGSDAPPCNTDAIPCGPPSLSINGGGGFGAIGNPIIGSNGSILGIDFINGGSGYISLPTVTIIDSCGIGGGAVIVPIISTESGTSLDDIDLGYEPDDLSATDRLSRRTGGNISFGTNNQTGSNNAFTGLGEDNLSFTARTNAFTGLGTNVTDNVLLGSGRVFTGFGTNLPPTRTPSFVKVGSLPLKLGSTGGSTLLLGGDNAFAGGEGGTPLIIDGSSVVAGGTGGIPLNVGSSGGTPVIFNGKTLNVGGSPVTYGGTGGFKVVAGSQGVSVGATNGTQVNINSLGGVPLTVRNNQVKLGGNTLDVDNKQINVGGNRGTTLVVGGSGKPVVTSDGSALSVNASGGTKLFYGEIPITVDGLQVTVGGSGGDPIRLSQNSAVSNRQTLVTDDNLRLTIGGEGGTPVLIGGNTIKVNGETVNSGSTGGIPISVGGNGESINTDDGTPLTIGGVGGSPALVNNSPVKVGGEYVTAGATGGSQLTYNGTNVGGSIVGSIVLDPGVGYLSAPNGDLGGNGTIWAPKNTTVVQRSDGTYDPPYYPGSTIEVLPGDSVKYPGQTAKLINLPQTIIAPEYQQQDQARGLEPSTSSGAYPVVLKIREVLVVNPGVAYLPTDKIKITPDKGAILEPRFDKQGRVIGVSVIDGGIGFTDFPQITIESGQGINAQMIPIFDIIRIGDLPEDQDIVPPGTPIINVVDCVGKL